MFYFASLLGKDNLPLSEKNQSDTKIYPAQIVKNLKNILKTVKPKLIIGPFTRESLLKIKPFAKAESIPVFTFSNDIALIEKNIWSLGFSPEEQIDSIFSCSLRNGSKRFGLIAPENLYGNIILDRSVSLIKTNKDNYFEKLRLSNKQINNFKVIEKRF